MNNVKTPANGSAARRTAPIRGATEPLLAPVVVISTFALAVPDALTLIVGGDDVHVAPVGNPAHVSVIVTVPLSDGAPVIVTGIVVFWPAAHRRTARR